MATILVAEDSVAYGVLYQEIFQTRDHAVKLTFDGQECLHEYASQPKSYDLVILDYMMPKKNGLDTAKEILTMNPHQKILFISSFGDELESKITDLGWDNMLQFAEKPFSSVDLVQKVEKLLELAAKITV